MNYSPYYIKIVWYRKKVKKKRYKKRGFANIE